MPRPRRWLLALVVALLPALAGAADSYQYDEVGNLQTLTNDTGTRSYTYDEVNRLDQETGPAGARDHAYDLNGNRSSDGAGTTATFTASTDRLATINGTAVTLDAAGNLTNDSTYAYTWDAAGRLKTVSKANKLWATYHYDYKSRRTRKETTSRAPQGAQVVVYHYDQDDNLLAETLATGAPLKTYIWDDGRLVGLLDHATTPPTLLTVDLDQLGTPRAARNAQGTVVWRWDSDGYGTTLPNEDPDGNGTKTTIHLRFPGQYYDQESGLHYNWNRYYSPRLGRYISADPIGVEGGVNLFGYVGGNPIAHTDPSGLWVLNALGGVAGVVTGGVGGYISSGGSWEAAGQGAAAGGAIGLVSPASALGTLLGGVAASAAGQVLGNLSNPCSDDPLSIDWMMAGVAGTGALGGRVLSGFLTTANKSASSYVIGRGLGSAPPAAQHGFNWFVEGSAGGWTEYGANRVQPPNTCGCK